MTYTRRDIEELALVLYSDAPSFYFENCVYQQIDYFNPVYLGAFRDLSLSFSIPWFISRPLSIIEIPPLFFFITGDKLE